MDNDRPRLGCDLYPVWTVTRVQQETAFWDDDHVFMEIGSDGLCREQRIAVDTAPVFAP